MKRKALTLSVGVTMMLAGSVFLLLPSRHQAQGGQDESAHDETVSLQKEAPRDRVETIEILSSATYGTLMEEHGVASADASAIYETSKALYDLASIRAGKRLQLSFDPGTGALKSLTYPISDEEELHVRKEAGGWNASKDPVVYEIRIKTVSGKVSSSLYASGLEQGMDERAVVELGDVFQWTIDFAQDVRVGDTFTAVYEERYRDGAYAMPGKILAASYVNDGRAFQAYWFKNGAGEEGYYDETGQSLRKMFLKAPVAFKYITSGFTTGLRYVSAFNTSTGHRAIDYAATLGTPIRATADGMVSFAGWDGPYGNKVSIRHNGTYSTNYCHQSRMIVKKGQKVSQGQIIGYVGSTGFSTGPHLHYEMVKNGLKINPLKETFPGTDPVAAEDKAAFEEQVGRWGQALGGRPGV